VRTAFHDAVARFGGSDLPRTGILLPSSAKVRATSDAPVAPTSSHALCKKRSARQRESRDRFTTWAREHPSSYPGPERLRP
jgi:hypothetical protein